MKQLKWEEDSQVGGTIRDLRGASGVKLTKQMVQDKFEVKSKTAQRDLSQLISVGKIRSVGPTSNQFFESMEKGDDSEASG